MVYIGKTDSLVPDWLFHFRSRLSERSFMDLKELQYIVTLADEGSISHAAEKLYMAQSSLSQFLQQYEAELGTTLFMRTSRGIRPTASGQTFIDHARQILLHYRRAQNEVWDIEDLKGGRIELGTATFRGTYLVPKVLKRFHEIYPHIHVSVTEMDSVPLEDRILEGLLDIALIALPAVKIKEHVDWLMRDEILLIAAKDHPLMNFVHAKEDGTVSPDVPAALSPPPTAPAFAPWVDLRDAAAFEFILGPPKTILGRAARREFKKLGIEPPTWNTSFTAPFAAAMAREGIALAFTYRSCIVHDENVSYLRIGKEGVWLDLGLTYPAGEYRSKATMELGRLFHEMYP